MNYFMLPQLYNETCENSINIIYNGPEQSTINLSLNIYLNKIKKQIDILEETGEWNIFKKYTNPYEYIHTTIPEFKRAVCTFRPISRSYFKLIEIIHAHNLNDTHEPISSFHLAEGPGGFIEALCNLRSNLADTYYGMTLINNSPDVPGWKKSDTILNSFPNIIIEKGADGTGDLFNIENLNYCKHKYGNKMHLITADGGFDFSIDFNKQELLATNLLFAQVSFAISMQKINGHFILKIFDIFTKTTIDIIYLLSTLYKEVYIVKPNTSRMANSEKYVVCKYFKKSQPELIDKIISEYHHLQDNPHISSILNFNIDYYYINKLEEINAIYGQQQIENILLTINLINSKNKHKNDKNDKFKIHNIQKCIQWCEKHNIPYNKTINTNNIFLNN